MLRGFLAPTGAMVNSQGLPAPGPRSHSGPRGWKPLAIFPCPFGAENKQRNIKGRGPSRGRARGPQSARSKGRGGGRHLNVGRSVGRNPESVHMNGTVKTWRFDGEHRAGDLPEEALGRVADHDSGETRGPTFP